MKASLILKVVILWQLLILLVTLVSPATLPLRELYLGGATQAYLSNPLLYSRANFDGNYFVYIAERGYGYALEAFFPFYPYLIKLFNQIFSNSVTSGVLISTISFTFGLYLFSKLILLDNDKKVVNGTITILLLFPVSFYFSFVYTEGLFFLLCIGSFYFSRKRNWVMAGILGGLASYTKFLGIVLFPSIIIEWWLQYKKINLYTLKKAIPILLIPLGLLIYANYLSDTKGDPLAFYKAQQLFGQERSITKIVLIYQVFWRYVKMLFTVNRSDFIFITVILELVTGIIFSITTIYSLIRQRKSYAIYNLLMYIIPTLTGSFTSLSRYVLLCFPSFMILGQAYSNASSINKKIISLAMGLAFVIFLTMFVRGYWLA